MIDINRLIDQQDLEEERDNRLHGNDDFNYLGDEYVTDEEEGK